MEATLPGRIHRRALFTTIGEIERVAPPRVIAEITLGYWLEALYLDPEVVETEVETPPEIYVPSAVERWIHDSEARWPTGTLLVTGLANYVHYGAHTQGPRLTFFAAPLGPRWELEGDFGILSYLVRPEEARLWRLVDGAPGSGPPLERDDLPPPGALDPPVRFRAGMERFEAGDHRAARAHFRVLMDAHGTMADDATFFYAVSFFRQENWGRASREFKHLLGRSPDSRWIPAVHWHIAICDLRRGRVRRARARFEDIVHRFARDPVTVANARAELERIGRRREGLLTRMWRRIRA
jgi:hypothetical protein